MLKAGGVKGENRILNKRERTMKSSKAKFISKTVISYQKVSCHKHERKVNYQGSDDAKRAFVFFDAFIYMSYLFNDDDINAFFYFFFLQRYVAGSCRGELSL